MIFLITIWYVLEQASRTFTGRLYGLYNLNMNLFVLYLLSEDSFLVLVVKSINALIFEFVIVLKIGIDL